MGPRIRTIKPEISTSPDFVKLSNVGRVAWYALIGQADDFGRLQGFDAHHLATTYCAPGTSEKEVSDQLDLMENLEMIRRYGGRTHALFTQLCNWSQHQKVEKPKVSRIPAPPLSKRRGLVGDSSGTRRAKSVHTGPDRTGSDRTGSDRTGSPPIGSPVGAADALVLVPPISLSQTEQVFEPWRVMWHPTARLTKERKAKIDGRLREGWSVADLTEAVTRGAANDPWAERHVALNDDIKNLLRNSGTVEKFLELASGAVVTGQLAMPKRKPSMSAFYRQEAERLAKEGD